MSLNQTRLQSKHRKISLKSSMQMLWFSIQSYDLQTNDTGNVG